MKEPSSRGKQPILIDEDDEDFEPPKKKDRKEEKLDLLISEVGSIQKTIGDMFSLTEHSPIPLGLKQIIRESFQYIICHRIPLCPPVIVNKCCKKILGCESCVNAWYSGPDHLTKTCPSCRAERGCIETMVLRGLNDFLDKIGKAINEDLQNETDV